MTLSGNQIGTLRATCGYDEWEGMMDVGSSNNVSSLFGSTPATSVSETRADATQGVSKDEFLQLLVAQLKNQDPLNPVNNEDFLAQLATFSSLEQLIAIKDGVNKLAGNDTNASNTGTDTQLTPVNKG